MSYERRRTDLFVRDVAWEDETHVLAVVHEDDVWWIIRLGLDGTIETASAETSGDDVASPFYLSTQP